MTDEQRSTLATDILRSLGHDPKLPPVFLTADEAATVLQQKPATLKLWRCTGRNSIPYTKLGREVRYRLPDLVDFIVARTEG